jgi:hypothetical protein
VLGWGLDSCESPQGTVVSFCSRGDEPLGSIQGGDLLAGWVTVRLSRRTALRGVGRTSPVLYFKTYRLATYGSFLKLFFSCRMREARTPYTLYITVDTTCSIWWMKCNAVQLSYVDNRVPWTLFDMKYYASWRMPVGRTDNIETQQESWQRVGLNHGLQIGWPPFVDDFAGHPVLPTHLPDRIVNVLGGSYTHVHTLSHPK